MKTAVCCLSSYSNGKPFGLDKAAYSDLLGRQSDLDILKFVNLDEQDAEATSLEPTVEASKTTEQSNQEEKDEKIKADSTSMESVQETSESTIENSNEDKSTI